MCTKFDVAVSLLLIERAGIQNYPIFRITPSYFNYKTSSVRKRFNKFGSHCPIRLTACLSAPHITEE